MQSGTDEKTSFNTMAGTTDSTTALQWKHSYNHNQHVFVANRVTEILDATDVSLWKQVNGINNPATIGTRAIDIEE